MLGVHFNSQSEAGFKFSDLFTFMTCPNVTTFNNAVDDINVHVMVNLAETFQFMVDPLEQGDVITISIIGPNRTTDPLKRVYE